MLDPDMDKMGPDDLFNPITAWNRNDITDTI